MAAPVKVSVACQPSPSAEATESSATTTGLSPASETATVYVMSGPTATVVFETSVHGVVVQIARSVEPA